MLDQGSSGLWSQAAAYEHMNTENNEHLCVRKPDETKNAPYPDFKVLYCGCFLSFCLWVSVKEEMIHLLCVSVMVKKLLQEWMWRFQTNPLRSAVTHLLLVFRSASNHLFNFNVPFFSEGVSEERDRTSCSSKPHRPDHGGTRRTTTSPWTRGRWALCRNISLVSSVRQETAEQLVSYSLRLKSLTSVETMPNLMTSSWGFSTNQISARCWKGLSTSVSQSLP